MTIVRVSPTVAPVQSQEKARPVESKSQPVSPDVDVGVPNVPPPLVPRRYTPTLTSPVVVAVNVPVRVAVEPGVVLEGEMLTVGVACDRIVSVWVSGPLVSAGDAWAVSV
jgi:hypothetical protein